MYSCGVYEYTVPKSMDETMDEDVKKQLLSITDCYRTDTRVLIRFLEEARLELDVGGLAAYATDLKRRGLAAATVNKHLQAAKNRLRLRFRSSEEARDVLAEYELNQALKEIRGLKLNTRAIDVSKTLSREEIRILLRSQATPERVRLIIEFLLVTGARISEATGILLANVRPEPGFYLIRLVGKGSKERTLKVRRELILRILNCFGGRRYLFESRTGNRYKNDPVSARIRLAGQTLLGRTISAHTMRHTFATHQIRKNRKVKALSIYLGHSSTSITQDMYVHEELDLEDLDLDL